jgi:hypothetical protein
MSLCRHCGEQLATRPRGLCASCYYQPELRTLYPPTGKCGRRGLDSKRLRRLPSTPTRALPGTPEKIAVLAERLHLGLELWHPDDASVDRWFKRRRAG